MKKTILSLLTGALFSSTMAMATPENGKVLVAYFTLSGNTEKVAKAIQKETGADLYQIELVTPYPTEYREQTKLAKQELADGTLPPIKPWPDNIAEYDLVYIGSPVWWGTMATPVRTFLKSGVLKGKTVAPFVTHGGGGAAKSYTDTAALCEGCNVITDGWQGYEGLSLGLSGWVRDIQKKAGK